MSVHLDDVFIAVKPEILRNIKKKSRRNSTSQSPEKSRTFLVSIMNGVAMRKVRMQK